MENNNTLFGKENLRWMLIGAAVIVLGLILLAGGKNSDPNVFDVNQVYGKVHITVAPLLIIGGLIIEVFAIMKKSK